MSLTGFAVIASAIMTLAVLATPVALRYLRRGQSTAKRPPEKWPLRVIYCIVAPILAFSIATALIILLVAGPCGLTFGFEEGTMLLAFGGHLIPLTAAALALAVALQHGREVVLTESILAALATIALIAYTLSPHQPPPTNYDPTNRCQIQGP
jgi:hypothetical protein